MAAQQGLVNINHGAQTDFIGLLREQMTNQAGSLPAMATSATAPALITSGTIATAGIAVARVTPAAAVTAVVAAAGTFDGQLLIIENKGGATASITFDVAATSNVQGGVAEQVPGLSTKTYCWDSVLARWVSNASTVASITNGGAVITGGTITASASPVSIVRTAPAGAITGVILAAGTLPGQVLTVINESVAASSITMAAAGTSNVADGVGSVIAGVTSRSFVWDTATSLWYPIK